jgi:non-homologous end joining protein Ku
MPNDDQLHELVRRAIDKARDHFKEHFRTDDYRCMRALMDRIESEIKLREFDAFRKEHPPWTPPRINPWGC